MATGGLYGSSPTGATVAAPGSESAGLYGNGTTFGGSYFEWFIFKQAETQPATPTGGSWSFQTNSGTPPTGWTATPPSAPTLPVWVSIALVNSRNSAALTWSTPGLFSFSSGLPILSGSGAPSAGDGITDQLYIQTSTTPETIWFKQAGTWTRLTGSSLYVDLTTNQTIAGTKTFSSQIQGSVSGTSANVTGIVSIENGGTGSTTAGAARTALGVTATGQDTTYAYRANNLSDLASASTARTNLGLGSAAVLNAGVANGVATLDSGGTVPLSQIPASIQGGVSYQGTWNASTNTPTLTSSVGTKGYYYVVSTAGSTNLNGITNWNIGDWAIYNGTAWEKIDNTDAVTSVNGYTGTVVLTNTDISGFGTMSTQNANAVAITGGTIAGLTSLASTIVTTPTVQAANSGGLSLKNSAGTTQMSMGGGGGDNLSINVSTNINGTNAQIDISPTGTGHVHIKPTGSNSVEIAPTSLGTINNMAIGGTTPSSGAFTTVTASTAIGIASGGTGLTTTPANGALDIGNGTGFTRTTLTAGSGVTITNASGSITINATGTGGTVTSVSGTGTVSGISLSGTVTTSGSLTLGGTLSLVSPPPIGSTTPNTGNFTTLTENSVAVVTQSDIGSAPNEIPLNQYLGSLAYQNGDAYFNTGMTVGFRNRIINGAMVISQRNGTTGTLITIDNQYGLDRWTYRTNLASKLTSTQSTNAPTGFYNSNQTTVTTSATPSAGDYASLKQSIEGYNIIDFAFGTADAKPITLSFWVRSSVVGTYGARVSNENLTQTFVFQYTVNAANTWEQKIITIGGSTTGTWNVTTAIGLAVQFDLGSGSVFETNTLNTWQNADVIRTPTNVKLITNSGATWYVTGVQLEKGNIATPFDVRPYGTEFQLCQRYYQPLISGQYVDGRMTVVRSAGATTLSMPVTFIQTMRASPSVNSPTVTDLRVNGRYGDAGLTGGTTGVVDITPRGCLLNVASPTASGWTFNLGEALYINSQTTATSIMYASAEL
jgi:hypothetical protein